MYRQQNYKKYNIGEYNIYICLNSPNFREEFIRFSKMKNIEAKVLMKFCIKEVIIILLLISITYHGH